TGCDLSQNMLDLAREKSERIKWLRVDMRDLPFENEFDAVIATLDSINHLKDEKAIERAFESIYKSLKKDGIFAADLNTPYKHHNILADNIFTFDYEDEGLYCVWENQQVQDDPLNRIEMFLEFFELLEDGNYKRSSDSLSEIALSLENITEILVRLGFQVLECSEYLTGEELEESSEKFTVIAKKVKE
ncbi:MAG: class I SAM-dependent methyltransferase, partial [Ruminiclostridium sp.]|nr:class I SAM-dependent methyltransferase [Ruminiclostridium sp.]